MVRRWWCESHRELAEPGDLDTWTPRIRYSPGGAIEYAADVEAEAERQRNEADRLARRRAERDEGLEVRARFDLEDPVAVKAHRLVKTGAIQALSIGYKVRSERCARDRANELIDVDLKEVSLVLAPANERARILAIKADDDEPDDTPSHTAIERRLIEAGILTRPADEQQIFEAARASMFRVLAVDQNGDEREKTVNPAAKAAAPVQIASFEVG